MLNKNTILGVDITNENDASILEYLFKKLKTHQKFFIVTPNPEILVYANSHEQYKKILNFAEISLADGTGLFLASLFLGKPLRQRVPGVDFVELICKASEKNPISIGFLGGRRGVAERTAECLLKKYPHLNIVYVGEEWDDNSKLHIDLLFVALGFPKQEEWIYKNLDHIPVTAAIGVGGAFDYISGQVKRAPFIIRAIGFEWLYRLFAQPWRWKRQLALIKFVQLIFREKFGKRTIRNR